MRDPVVRVGQALGEAREKECPHRRSAQRLLERRAEARQVRGQHPGLDRHRPARVTVAAHEVAVGSLRVEVAEARDVDAVRSVAVVVPAHELGGDAEGDGAVPVVHHVAPERAAAVREPVGKTPGARVQQHLHARYRRGAQEHELRREARALARHGVDHAHARGALAHGVVVHALHDAVRAQRQQTGARRGGQGRAQAAETGP